MEEYDDYVTHIKIIGNDDYNFNALTDLFKIKQNYGKKWIRQDHYLRPERPLLIKKNRVKKNIFTSFPAYFTRHLLNYGSPKLLQKLCKVHSSFVYKIGLICRRLVVSKGQGTYYYFKKPKIDTSFFRSSLYLNFEDYKEPWFEMLNVYESFHVFDVPLENIDCITRMIQIASKHPLKILTINGCQIPSEIQLLASETIAAADFGRSQYIAENGSVTDFFAWFPNATFLRYVTIFLL